MNFMNFARLLRLTRLIPPLRLSLSKPDRRALLHTGFDRLNLSGLGVQVQSYRRHPRAAPGSSIGTRRA